MRIPRDEVINIQNDKSIFLVDLGLMELYEDDGNIASGRDLAYFVEKHGTEE